jgi:hypothetical protein
MFAQECRVLRATLQKVVNRQDTILEVIQQQNHQLLEMMMQQQQQERPPGAVVIPPTPQPTVRREAAGDDAADNDHHYDAPVDNTATAATAAGVRFSRLAVELGLDQVDVLMHSNTPRIPSMGDKFPKCWVHLVQEWKRCDLQSFHSSKQDKQLE